MNFQDIVASASPEVYTNENFETIDYASVYGKRQPVTTGLTWGYYGGRWNGIAIAAGTISLTNNIENYISVNRSTGAIGKEATTGSPSVAPTNWNNLRDYARVYKLWVSGGVVTSVEDHRAGQGGIFGPRSITATRVPFGASDGSLTDDSGFTFNTTGDILTIGAVNVAGTTAPTVGWYNPSSTIVRTPNPMTVDGAVILSSTASIAGTLSPLGLLDISGASAGQVKFPATQNASSDANTLDDYEEGTWTPVLSGAGTAGTYETGTNWYGTYTKIGRFVSLSAVMTLAGAITGGGTGIAKITGLPFAKGSQQYGAGSCMSNGVNLTAACSLTIGWNSINSDSTLLFFETTDDAALTNTPISGFSAGDYVGFNIMYFT